MRPRQICTARLVLRCVNNGAYSLEFTQRSTRAYLEIHARHLHLTQEGKHFSFFSSSIVSCPFSAAAIAANIPAGPPPTTITLLMNRYISYFSIPHPDGIINIINLVVLVHLVLVPDILKHL